MYDIISRVLDLLFELLKCSFGFLETTLRSGELRLTGTGLRSDARHFISRHGGHVVLDLEDPIKLCSNKQKLYLHVPKSIPC
jgi:hypothetical protein